MGAGDFFLLRAGATKLMLPRPTEERDAPAETTIEFKAGDTLGPLAMSTYLAASAVGEPSRSGGGMAESSRMVGVEPSSKKKKGVGFAASVEGAPSASKKKKRRKGGAVLLRVPAALGAAPTFPAGLRAEAERGFMRKVMATMDAFQQFTGEELDTILSRASRVTHPPGTTLSEAGSTGAAPLYLIVDGKACAWRRVELDPPLDDAGADWRKTIATNETLGYFALGDHFGAVGILDPEATRKVSVTSLVEITCLGARHTPPVPP